MPEKRETIHSRLQMIASLLGEHARSWQVAMPGSVYFLLSFTGFVHVWGQRWGARRWPERGEG